MTWLLNFLARSTAPNYLLTTEDVISVTFLWLYSILSKIKCIVFYSFSKFCFSIFSLHVWLSLLLFFLQLGNGFFLNHIFYPSHNIEIFLFCLIILLEHLHVWFHDIFFWQIFHPNTTFLAMSNDFGIFKKLLRSSPILQK